jgi:hypothetical protein
MELDVKVSSGCRSASKKSGLCRCPARFSSWTWTEATFAEPLSTPSLRAASNSLKVPWNAPAT